MYKHIYLVRHGETEFNLEGKIQGGGLDSPLTEKGKEQAKKLADHLKDSGFSVNRIYASPLGRAMETARILNEALNLEINEEPLLKEINCGNFEGKLISSIDSEKLRKLRVDPEEKYPGGENVIDVKHRAEQFLNKIRSDKKDSVLIVSHGNFNRAFACAATGMNSFMAMKIYQDNTGFNYLFKSGEYYRIGMWNSTAHLGFLPKQVSVT
ncbi:MAG: histidine phosphatase family protein [Leptospiraceae bacterium]|nr:histidine phosphatase family protein [Leptospiraceae bacterium]